MVYEENHNNEIHQGDILINVPYFGVMSNEMQDNWIKEIKGESDPTIYTLDEPIAVKCILLTQNCDIRRDRNLVLARIHEKNDLSNKVKSRVKQIYQIIRNETRSHYLPHSENIEELSTPHTIDFKDIFVISSNFIIDNINLFFLGRLKLPAIKILQEKLTRFFTRLAFDEEILYSDEELKYKISQGNLTLSEVNAALKSVNRIIPED